MAHLRDIQLIEHCQGSLSDQARADVDAHLAVCGDCAGRYQQIRETWQTLGDWRTAPVRVDLASQVLDAINADQDDLCAQGPYRLSDWIWPMAKVAASVGLAAVLGYAVGISVRPSATSNVTAAQADPQQAATELYLDVLSDDSPSGLTSVILPTQTPDEEV